jgi:hypothetical protein
LWPGIGHGRRRPRTVTSYSFDRDKGSRGWMSKTIADHSMFDHSHESFAQRGKSASKKFEIIILKGGSN